MNKTLQYHLTGYISLLVCRNKVLQSRELKQETVIFSQIWRLEAQDQGTSGLGFCEASLLSLT